MFQIGALLTTKDTVWVWQGSFSNSEQYSWCSTELIEEIELVNIAI